MPFKAVRRHEKQDISKDEPRLWTRSLVFLILIQAADNFVYNMITPVIARYAMGFGVSLALAGIAASVFALAALFTRPASGLASDSFGCKILMLISIAASTCSFFAYAFATSFVVLVAIRIVHGIFYALFSTSIAAMAVATIPGTRRGEGMSWFSMAYVIGNALGPATGVFVSDTFGYMPMFIVGTCITAASFGLACALTPVLVSKSCSRDAKLVRKRSLVGCLISPRCIPLAIVICVYATIWGFISTYIVLAGEQRAVMGISAFFVFNAITLFVTRPFAGRIYDRQGLARIYYLTAIFEAIAIVLIAYSGQLWLFLVAAICKAFGSGTAWPSIQAECAGLEPESRNGVAMATFLFGCDVGYTLGPALGGVLSQEFGYTVMFLACLPVLLVGIVVFMFWSRHRLH